MLLRKSKAPRKSPEKLNLFLRLAFTMHLVLQLAPPHTGSPETLCGAGPIANLVCTLLKKD